MKNYLSGESFVDSIYQNLINSEEVKRAIKRRKINPKNREDAIKMYMDRLEKAHFTERKLTLIKSLYHKRYVIDHLPESYIQFQKKISREQGRGDIRITEERKNEMLNHIQDEQKKSLDLWLNYLNSKDVIYPMWFKYYAFQGMLKLGKYDKERGRFTKRSKDTTTPFIEVNAEIIGQMYTLLLKMIEEKELHLKEINALNKGESFNKLYTYILNNMISDREKLDSKDGIWVKYNQGCNHNKLWQSLQGKNTGWCTAGEETCRIQIEIGDFYVYYTKDENEEYNIPRVAIRMKGHDEIAEVRGIDKNQNLESEMIEVAEKKLDEFSDKEKYIKKVNDMKLITIIDKKTNNDEELTKEEIRFLYEIGYKIEGFGLEDDPRIEEIKAKRNVKKDLSYLFDCKEENIGTKIEDFDKNEIFAYVGNISLQDNVVPDKFKSLKVILGDADFRNLTSSQGLDNLKSISGDAYFDNLINSQDLKSLKTIHGNARFYKLTSALGLENLQSIGLNACFDNLTDSQALKNLKTIGGDAEFYKLTSAQGLEKLQSIGASAYFNNLSSAQGLVNLQKIGLNAIFYRLTNSKGLENLKIIDGYADFRSLNNAQGLENLQIIGRDVDFRNLTSSESLINLEYVGGNADFRSLISAQGLENLQSIGASAYFKRLTNAQGLNNLQRIGRDANFRSLTSARGLEKLISIGGYADFNSLTSAEGLENLRTIGKDAYFKKLISAEGLKKLQSIGRYAYFNSLVNAKSIEHIKVGSKIILPINRFHRGRKNR